MLTACSVTSVNKANVRESIMNKGTSTLKKEVEPTTENKMCWSSSVVERKAFDHVDRLLSPTRSAMMAMSSACIVALGGTSSVVCVTRAYKGSQSHTSGTR